MWGGSVRPSRTHKLADDKHQHGEKRAALKVARPGVPLLPIDLRVDLSETPIEDLRRYWVMWEPMSEGYVQRCVDPANSPAASLIEGHA